MEIEPNLEFLVSTLKPVMRRAGKAIIEVYKTSKNEIETKGDGSPVTIADKRSEKILIKALLKIAPDIPIISEENSSSHLIKPSQIYFLVDPLDGTKEFLDIHGSGDFTVNIGLILNGKPILGLIYAPVSEQLFYGLSSSGSYIEKQGGSINPIRIRKTNSERSIAVASKKHQSEETNDWLLKNNISDIISVSSSIKFCSVAKGDADVYPRFAPTMEWDTAAGHAILLGAGGSVTLDDGVTPLLYGKKDYRNGNFIAWGGMK